MTFVSYAQNFEDVLIQRIFSDINRGFYIDVGAAWPKQDSVTCAFYERGWTGINIEPNPKLHEALCQHRPNDINLNLALDSEPGYLNIFFFANEGLSTADKKIANRHKGNGESCLEQRIECTTLRQICETYVQTGTSIDFLKIDVEGLERQVLEGADFANFRPKLVIIESTEPMSIIPTWNEWEHLLVHNGYEFCYFDGLNRFYIDSAYDYLKSKFDIPVNLWDDFKTHEKVVLEDQVKSQVDIISSLNSEREQIRNELDEILNSRTWRYTHLLRKLMNHLKRTV